MEIFINGLNNGVFPYINGYCPIMILHLNMENMIISNNIWKICGL